MAVQLNVAQDGLRQVAGDASAAAMAPSLVAGVPQTHPDAPTSSSSNFGVAATGSGSIAGFRLSRDDLTQLELDFRMWEGSDRDREPLEISKDAIGYSCWHDWTLMVSCP